MSLYSINPTKTVSWKKLCAHFSQIEHLTMQKMFEENPSRAEQMIIEWKDLTLDYSKQRITRETISLLQQLAKEVQLKEGIEQLFSGSKINITEDRAVLHTALRNRSETTPEVNEVLEKMKHFSEDIASGKWKGFTNKSITDVVNIGIGGSSLGPEMVIEALSFYKNHLTVHFISNIDGDHVQEKLKLLNPETTLFVIVSKSFTTQETITNAQTVRDWFLEKANEIDIAKHFVAVSSNIDAVRQFGISSSSIFPMWDWVGGRFSLWSAVGLSICCSIGFSNFEELLQGAHDMDVHFKETPFEKNIPVILALLSVWNTNFFGAETEVVVPYTQYLSKFVPYLQQLTMESNGKSVDRNGETFDYQTGPIVWGSTGTNAQHAFFQLIHQGTKLIPADFIVYKESLYQRNDAQKKLVANCFAQSEALLKGTYGKNESNVYKIFPGNKPSNTLIFQKLTPRSLGHLLALYEHKTFVQGVVWNICSFDQWGVQLGKEIARSILSVMESKNSISKTDS